MNVNGNSVTITRTKGPDGKEKITVTTLRPNGKPKVRELTPEEFEKEFGDRRKGAKKEPAKDELPLPAQAKPAKPEPAAPAIPLPNTQPAATE